MLGRRLDRYIGMFFIWHFVLTLAAIVALYVVIDTFSNLEDFLDAEGVIPFLRWIVTYHAYQIPPLLTQFFPLVALLAGVISISRLARYNELNAIKAVGVSLYRALAPVLLGAVGIGVLAAANQELLVPSIAQGIVEVRSKAPRKDTYRDLECLDRTSKAIVWVRLLEYAIPGFEVAGVDVRPTGQPPADQRVDALRVRNAQGIWVQHWLFLFHGDMQNAKGQWEPFAYRSLTTADDATTYTMPRRPRGAAAAAPMVSLAGERRGTPVAVTLGSWKHKHSLRFILGAQATTPLRGEEETSAPLVVQAALWRDHERVWLGRANTYEVTGTRRNELVYDGSPLPLAIPPHEMIKSEADPTLKSFGDLLSRYRAAPPAARQKVLLVLHSRVAFPFASLVLLLVAIPLLFQQEGGKSTWVGMGLALLVSMCFYFVNYVCQLSGQSAEGIFAGAPAIAAWLPLVGFGAVGCVLLAKMNT